jgi:hypothetical protein
MSDTFGHDIPDSAAVPDPIDTAYAQAEAILGHDDGRAARRAKVLAAVAREPAAPAAPVRSHSGGRSGRWLPGGWLAAACVAGLGLFLVIHIYQPFSAPAQTTTSVAPPTPPGRPPEAPAASAKPGEAAGALRQAAPAPRAAAPPAPQPSPAAPPSSGIARQTAIPPRAAEDRSADSVAPGDQRGDISGGYAGPAPAPPPAPEPAPPPATQDAQSSTTVSEEIVTAERRAPSVTPKVPVAVSVFTGRQRDVVGIQTTSDPSAALRAAAAEGRASDVKALLAQGATIDAADDDGDTALMKSIQADHPGVAALLHRHGASLDQQNHAGESARDMATASKDAALRRALGLEP